MALENERPESIAAGQALQIGITAGALHHLRSIDLRTAALLSARGILKNQEPLPHSDLIIAVLSDPKHPNRALVQPGPMLFYNVGEDKSQRFSVSVADLVLSPDDKLRNSAIAYLRNISTSQPTLMSSRSKKAITDQGNDLLATDSERWLPAAVGIADLLRDDFYLNMAGVRQSLELKFDDGLRDYSQPLFRPTTALLESVDAEFPLPSGQHKDIEQKLQSHASEATSLSDACDRYYRSFGHLPLAERFSLGRLIDIWVEGHGRPPDQIWDDLWSWADGIQSPLPRYHLCTSLLRRINLVPEEKMSVLCEELVNVVHMPQTEDSDHKWTQAWRIRCQLAQHYEHLLECLWPERKSEVLAGLAWWLAEQVSCLFGADSRRIQKLRDNVIARECGLSSNLFQIGRFPLEPSKLRFVTLSVHSVWSLAALCQLASALNIRILDRMSTDHRKHIEMALNAVIISAFPLEHLEESRATYAFEYGLDDTFAKFVRLYSEKVFGEKMTELANAVMRLLRVDSLKDNLSNMTQLDEDVQALTTFALRMMSYADALPKDLLWEFLNKPEWRTNVFSNIRLAVLQELFEAISEVHIRNREKWIFLPQFYAAACEQASKDRDRQKLLFTFTVVSSLNSDTVSGVERLLFSRNRQQFVEDVAVWRRLLEQLLVYAPPTVAPRIRAMLAVLRID